MPIDIFVEVCYYLTPYDLRRLSHTCTRLRDLLMSKKARYIWQAVLLSSNGLPECPSDLNEPQYVRLLYSSECFTPSVKEADLQFKLIQEKTCDKDIQQAYEDDMVKRFQSRQAIAKAILKWRVAQAETRIEEIAAAKQSRCESIKAKLKEVGWDERDFPLEQREYRDLVYRDQKLTPKVWQAIRPRLESMIVKRREERLEEERQALMKNRKRLFGELYAQLVESLLGLPNDYMERVPYVPGVEEVWNLPWVQSHMDQINEALSVEEWREDIADDLRLFILDQWRNFLRNLVEILEGQALTTPSSHVPLLQDEMIPGGRISRSSKDGIEAINDDIDVLKNRLSLATSAFDCQCGLFDSVMWFPDVLKHGLLYHDWTYPQQFLQHLIPFSRRADGLVQSLLRGLRLDPNSATIGELNGGANWLCLRCDPQVARYLSFKEIVEHYLSHRKWFDEATAARGPFSGAHGSLLVDDHDWSDGAPSARQDDEYFRILMEGLQAAFRAECMNGLGGDAFNVMDDALRKVSCALCPTYFGPPPDYLPKIRIHVLHKHQKELDPNTDITHEGLCNYLCSI
ncbi:hypothetical protein M407DRAFT_17938 [Tulasnella calospora MUT 4182]|uniref:F-box domain-containing protein n=1 Tax=Tulasnella calospora MUT 4182 TaxID=1051891 RepID=A0A0C3LGH6_9AGAM|nr:hypothetical protein M407DRAFT_17938 [Tulasnella calospora MUT 4182]